MAGETPDRPDVAPGALDETPAGGPDPEPGTDAEADVEETGLLENLALRLPWMASSTAGDAARIREKYGWLRGHYRMDPTRYRDLRRWLNQSRAGISYDVYLARSAYYAVLAAVLGALLSVFVTLALAQSGFIADFRNPLSYRGDFVFYLARNRTLFAGALVAIAVSALLAATVWYARYYYPRLIVDKRRRNIDVTMPHAITFMYALSYGGMDLLEVFRVLGNAQDTYGEVSNEFEMVVRDVDLFGNDLTTALRNARNLTPSDSFEGFLDDVLAVMESGGDAVTFFEEAADDYLETARDEQLSFLQALALFSEVFVVLFVAAPLFLVVILLVISLLGGETLQPLTLLVYAVLPLGMAGFVVLLDTLSEPYRAPKLEYDSGRPSTTATGSLLLHSLRDALADTLEWLGREEAPTEELYERHRRQRRVRGLVASPVTLFRDSPLGTLLVSVPLALVVLAVVLGTGLAELSVEAFVTEPIPTTTFAVMIPLLVVLVPLSVFHELKARRNRLFVARFPDTLNVLSSANRMGIELTDALALVARWSRGPLATELRKVRNDIRWNFDTRGALLALGARMRVTRLARTLKLIAEGTRSSSDLARVLSVAATDARERSKIARQRRAELTSYLAVVVIGFLVYLLVVLVLDASYLDPIAATGTDAAPVPGDRSVPLTLTNIPVDNYRMLLFHSSLVQALGIGLIAGKLVDDSVLSGLKYSIVLVVLSLVTFALV